MKSPQKKMPAKKQSQLDCDVGENLDLDLDFSNAETIILSTADSGIDFSNMSAAQGTYTIGNIDTITLDPTYYSSGSDTLTWTGSYDYGSNGIVNIGSNGIDMKEGSDIRIGGKSLNQTLEHIEDRLAILKPNPELEERWEDLKELRRKYVEMERDILEKEKIMKILKD
jgi:hypothetical protein